MKRIKTLSAGTKQQPKLNARINHIQKAIEESLQAAIGGQVGEDSALYYIVSGCVINQVGLQITMTEGAIYYQGEVYMVPAITTPINLISTTTAIGTITTSYAAVDPITFSDSTTGSVHEIKTIVLTDGTSVTADIDLYDCINLPKRKMFTDVMPHTLRI